VNRRSHVAVYVGLAMSLFFTQAAAVAPLQFPRPPCAVKPIPDYPKVGEASNAKLWTGSDLGPGWTPPSCTAWPSGAATIVTGLARHSKYSGSADAVLERFGAISSLVGVRYWSVTDSNWNNMFVRAVALAGPDSKKTRGDFSTAELRSGRTLYFVAADNRSGKDAVSRLHVIAADSEHLVIETENVTPLRWMFLTYAAPGNFQTWYFLDRETDGTWRFYSLTRVLYASSLFGSVIPDKSYINRAEAMSRYFLDLPSDRDPPAAP
jgi:hypothetical protein